MGIKLTSKPSAIALFQDIVYLRTLSCLIICNYLKPILYK